MPGIKNEFWEKTESFFVETGNVMMFTANIFTQFFRKPFEHGEFVRQAYRLGNKSVALIAITGFILGLVMTLQTQPVLVMFGAQALLPGMVAVSIIREIGPMVTALLCAGKMSSSIGAELGSMRVTEQLDAMEVSGTNPMKYVVTSRVIATTLMVPILTIVADTVALYGSYVAINIKNNVTLGYFLSNAFSALSFSDVFPSVIKTFFFGFFIGLIGCYKGYNASEGTESVGVAANTSVVTASMVIFFIDLIAVQVIQLIYGYQ